MSNQRYTIYDWMFNLDLNLTEVNAYALIYSFCKSGKEYTGSFSYLAKRLHISDRQAVRLVNKLVEKKILFKTRTKNGNAIKLNTNLCQNVTKTYDILSPNNKTIYGSGGIVTNTTTNKKVMKKLVIKNKDGTLKEVS